MKTYKPESSNYLIESIGEDNIIHSHVWIGHDVKLGKRVRVQAFSFIPNGVKIGDNVFIGPNVVFTNDKYPPSGGEWSDTVVEDGVSIGAGAVILPGLTIGKGAVIGAGSVVTKNVIAGKTVVGNPAKPLRSKAMKVICEVSARHYHPDYELDLEKKKDLSQNNHWVAKTKVEAKGLQFSIIMPPRPKRQYEMSITDWYKHMEGEPQFEGEFQVALRHFHCDQKTADELGIVDGQKVAIYKDGIRAGRLDNVVVRIDDWAVPRVHIDTDEANALLVKNGDEVELII